MMSEPLELKEQTPYAIDRLDTLKAAIMHSIQEMVIHRAKVEKYRKSDLPTARSAYETLEYFRKQLAEQLMESQLILLETEAYKLASMAGQLHQGVSGFNLMSTGYKPIYEVLNKFTSAFPTGQKTNAAVIGRLMNNIKLGYPMAGDEDIEMIMNELMLTVFDEGASDDEDDMVTVRFSHDYIDRLYAQGCKDGGLFPFRINAWQEKIKDIFLFYVADASYSVFDVRYHFSGTNVKLDITLSPDCCTPDIFLNTFVNLILYCQREVERIEAVEADERNAVAYIGKEAA